MISGASRFACLVLQGIGEYDYVPLAAEPAAK